MKDNEIIISSIDESSSFGKYSIERKEKQKRLDDATTKVMNQKNCPNFIESLYLLGLCEAVNNEDIESLFPLKSRIQKHKDYAWEQSFNICLTFLERNHMKNTIEAIMIEKGSAFGGNLIRKQTDLDGVFDNLLYHSARLQSVLFKDCVKKFNS